MEGKRNYHFWTKEEERILAQKIKENPYNIAKGIREASIELYRSECSCKRYWYYVLNNPKSKKYIGNLFITLGHESTYINRKVNTDKSTVKPTKISYTSSIWNTLRVTIKKILFSKNI